MNYTTPEVQCASISVKRNRLKQYGDKVYLKDKQEFEIELFNPTNSTRLAKIAINGKSISSSGIVLKPGQRVFLERYIDTPSKFQFETYKVEDSPEAKIATALNGLVQIDFYDEYVPSPYSITYTNNYDNLLNQRSRTSYGTLDTMSFCSMTTNCSNETASLKKMSMPAEKETGRVEKGSSSNQSFTNYYGNFNTWASKSVKITILPMSEKPVEKTDLANYCTNCGAKNKGNKYKFCPSCGTKF